MRHQQQDFLRVRFAGGVLHADVDHGGDVRADRAVVEEEGEVRRRTSGTGPVPEAGGKVRRRTEATAGEAAVDFCAARDLEEGGKVV